MPKLVKNNGDPILSNNSLMKNDSTRLRFSIWVIIANFIMGTVGMILGSDLTALGVFISLCNTPLYAYILGRTFRGADVPKEYYNQSHGGAGGLGNIINYNGSPNNSVSDTSSTQQSSNDEYNIPPKLADRTTKPKPVVVVNKPEDEIG